MDCRVKPGNDGKRGLSKMVAFSLPKNSVVTDGKAWPKPQGATETREFRVYRWNPDDDKWMKHTLAWFEHTGKVPIDYRPVHNYTMTNDVQYIPPKARVY